MTGCALAGAGGWPSERRTGRARQRRRGVGRPRGVDGDRRCLDTACHGLERCQHRHRHVGVVVEGGAADEGLGACRGGGRIVEVVGAVAGRQESRLGDGGVSNSFDRNLATEQVAVDVVVEIQGGVGIARDGVVADIEVGRVARIAAEHRDAGDEGVVAVVVVVIRDRVVGDRGVERGGTGRARRDRVGNLDAVAARVR